MEGIFWTTFRKAIWGEVHSVYPQNAARDVPEGAFAFSAIHSHPNSSNFSKNDKKFASSKSWSVYVVVKNEDSTVTIKKWADERRGYKERVITDNLVVNKLNTKQKEELKEKFKKKWSQHIWGGCENGFGCENKKWPRGE